MLNPIRKSRKKSSFLQKAYASHRRLPGGRYFVPEISYNKEEVDFEYVINRFKEYLQSPEVNIKYSDYAQLRTTLYDKVNDVQRLGFVAPQVEWLNDPFPFASPSTSTNEEIDWKNDLVGEPRERFIQNTDTLLRFLLLPAKSSSNTSNSSNVPVKDIVSKKQLLLLVYLCFHISADIYVFWYKPSKRKTRQRKITTLPPIFPSSST